MRNVACFWVCLLGVLVEKKTTNKKRKKKKLKSQPKEIKISCP